METKKNKSLSPAEMLKTVSFLVNAHITVTISNGTQFFEKAVASYSQYLSRILPSSMIHFIFTKSVLMQVLLPEALPFLQRVYPPDVGPSGAPPHSNRSNSPHIGISSFMLTNCQIPRCLPRQVNGQHLPY